MFFYQVKKEEKKALCFHEFKNQGIKHIEFKKWINNFEAKSEIVPLNVLTCTKCGTEVYLPLNNKEDLDDVN